MRVAIISDTHDNIWRLDYAIRHMAEIDVLLHCGDLCSPFVGKQLGEAFPEIPIHIVWGNNDGDKPAILKVANPFNNIKFHGEFAELTIDGKKVAINHYPEIGRALAESKKYDLVCYGHDHLAFQEEIGSTILLNPGEIMGLLGTPSFVVWDTQSNLIETVMLS